MINNDWQALGVGLLDTREITARIVASNTVTIDLPMCLQLQPYCQCGGMICSVPGFETHEQCKCFQTVVTSVHKVSLQSTSVQFSSHNK